GTYAHGITISTEPFHTNWEIPLDSLPKVARLQPIRPRRWPWVFFGLLAAAAAAVYFWLPSVDPKTLPPDVAAVVVPVQAALADSPLQASRGSAGGEAPAAGDGSVATGGGGSAATGAGMSAAQPGVSATQPDESSVRSGGAAARGNSTTASRGNPA